MAPIPGLTMEISEAGFSSMLANSLEVGDRVIARFELPPTVRVSFEALVRNKNLFRYGFEFLSLTDQGRWQIKKACESLPIYEGGWL
jgi:hypothetical protein